MRNTGNRNTGDSNTGDRNTGDSNTGDSNTGNRNTGYWNIGNRNTGDSNTGNRNTGDSNTGNRNTGDSNTGNWNTGNRNTGDSNTGNRNTGYWNTGDWNTGDWNTGNWNTGYFNIDEPKIRIFGKETDIKREDIVFPSFLYFCLTKRISEDNMTEEQKEDVDYSYYKTTGGILMSYEYKEAFKKSYESLSEEDRKLQTKQLRELPNFDAKIFKEISGIDINDNKEVVKKEIVVDGKTYILKD